MLPNRGGQRGPRTRRPLPGLGHPAIQPSVEATAPLDCTRYLGCSGLLTPPVLVSLLWTFPALKQSHAVCRRLPPKKVRRNSPNYSPVPGEPSGQTWLAAKASLVTGKRRIPNLTAKYN